MSDLISRKALLNHLSSWQMEQFAEVGHEKEYNLLDMIIRGVENEPTVEQPKGEWMVCDDLFADATVVKCSACGATDFVSNHVLLEVTDVKMHNFCPHCGCDMRKKV